ncbi:MAG TPA: DedA family protein [Ktedonobacterales bacterium]|nr:DedA family protein [Ktedonobacterales bacterium]
MDTLLGTLDASSPLLADMQVNSYLALWVIVFLGSVGIPLPTDPVLLAAAALAGHGELNALVVALVAISAAACGDAASYLIGRTVGSKVVDWLEGSRIGQRIVSTSMLTRGGDYFSRYGGWAIFLSRWLAGVFSGVVNILAGVRRFPFLSFLTYAVAGEVVDVGIMLTLGIAFGASWAATNTVLKIVLFTILGAITTVFLLARLLFPFRRAPSGTEHGDATS